MSDFEQLSWILDICPGIGEAKAVLELISGKDLITQEDLDAFDRATCAISVVPVASWIVKLKKSQKAIKHAAKFTKFFKVVEGFNKANDAVDKFNLIRLLLDESGCNTCSKKLDYSLLILPLFPVKVGKYIVHSSVNFKYVWDVDLNSSNLQVWERHGGLNQQFIFNPNFLGVYTITCAQNGKAIDCAFSSRENGANVWAYECNDTSAQHWNIHSANQGNIFPFIKRVSIFTQIDYTTKKRCIDLKYSDAKNGTNIWLYEENGTNAQKWYLEHVNED